MRVGVMVTNYGSHPSEKWAAESAAQLTDIIVIDPNSVVRDTMQIEKANLANILRDTLGQFHEEVKLDELSKLESIGSERLNHLNYPDLDHLDDAVDAVQMAADKTIFGPHFRKPEVRDFIYQTLGSHFSTVRETERSWYADKHPDLEHSKIYRQRTASVA